MTLCEGNVETASKPWVCRRCGRQLAVIEGEPPRLVFDSAMLPSLIRDCLGFVDIECPRCGEVRKWIKMVDSSAES